MKAVAELPGPVLGSLGEYLFPADLGFVVYRNGTSCIVIPEISCVAFAAARLPTRVCA